MLKRTARTYAPGMDVHAVKLKQIGWLNRNLEKIKGQHPKFNEAKVLLQTLVLNGVYDL